MQTPLKAFEVFFLSNGKEQQKKPQSNHLKLVNHLLFNRQIFSTLCVTHSHKSFPLQLIDWLNSLYFFSSFGRCSGNGYTINKTKRKKKKQ